MPLTFRTLISALAIAGLLLLVVALLGCRRNDPNASNNDNGSADNNTGAAEGELGSPTNPYVLAFVPSSEVQGSFEEYSERVATYLEQETGYSIQATIAADNAVVTNMGAGSIHMAFLGPKGYADAYKQGGRIKLGVLRDGFATYWTMLFTQTNPADGEPIMSLADCDNRPFLYRNVTSTSGYVYPMRLMRQNNITASEERATGGHEQTVNEVVSSAEPAFGAGYWSPPNVAYPGIDEKTFTFGEMGTIIYPTEQGEFRLTSAGRLFNPAGVDVTAEADITIKDVRARPAVLQAHPNVMADTRIIAFTEAIPNDGVVFRGDMDEAVVESIVSALLAYAETDEGKAALDTMLNITGLQRVTDEDYAAFREEMDRR